MTPLEKAKAEKGRVNYCGKCEQFQIVGNVAYCKVDGKLIHPIMMMIPSQGTGPAWNCKKRKPLTNYDLLISRSPEELANILTTVNFSVKHSHEEWLKWLKEEVSDAT